ncbi:MAG: hypothetical protein HOO67_07340 [Candidatus Peribacteraceae bacterium]|nr:hypothetical protein [Candidatus Peribacteraceae bacterium]
MKRLLILIVLLSFGLSPAAAFARVTNEPVQRPSRRVIRETAREATVWNPQMLSINELPLDRTYESAAFGVKFQFPSAWEHVNEPQETPPLTLVTMFLSRDERPAGFRQNVNMVIEALPSDMSLAEYTDMGIRIERDFFDHYALLQSEDITLAGFYLAHRVVFSASLDNGDMTFEQIWLLRGRQAYVWTFADSTEAFDEHVGTFEKMMDTLTVR